MPALVQPTKRGELFLLDRRTGTPIADVEERPVPQGPVEYEWLSKTQPFSIGMPSFRPDVSEADMWGLTPFDQMWCRREFRKMRYEGHFTPPSVEGTFVFPGNAGGFNWGGVAVDEDNQLLVATPLIMGSRLALIPRDKVPKDVKRYLQLGTPYAADIRMFMSPLQMPCMRPPYGRIAVVDLQTRQVLWNKRLGTTNESGPLGQEGRRAPADGRAARRGLDRHAGRLDLLRRRHGSLLPRVRREDRRRAVARLPAGAGAGDADELSLAADETTDRRDHGAGRGPLRHGGVGRQVAARSARRPHHRLRAAARTSAARPISVRGFG